TRLQGDWSSDVCSSDLHTPSSGVSPPHTTQNTTPGAQGAWHVGALVIAADQRWTGGILVEPGCGRKTGIVVLSGRCMRFPYLSRSEERRVGKECTSLCW